MISIQNKAQNIMTQDSIRSFPDECCGFFFGQEDGAGNRVITKVLVVNNAKEGDKGRRFEIAPKDYLKAERYAETNGLLLLGVYHSHPNHPAIPSEQDRQAAQPYFSYIIIAVYDEEVSDIRSWKLNEAFRFEEERISSAALSNDILPGIGQADTFVAGNANTVPAVRFKMRKTKKIVHK